MLGLHDTVVRSPNSYTSRKEGEIKHNSSWLRSVKRKCEASLWKESIECEGKTMEEIVLPRRRSSVDSPAKLAGSTQHCYTYTDGRTERDLLSKMGHYSQRVSSLEEKKCPHHHHNRSFPSENREVLELKEALRSQIEAFNALHNELEDERNASAIAANETLSMILRLQEEKSAVEMETRQFKRIAEEREAHCQETIALLKEFLMEREEDIILLEEELQMCREFLSRYEKNSCERDEYLEKLLGNNVRTPTSSCLLAETSACYISNKQFPSRYERSSSKRDEHSETFLGNTNERTRTSSILVDTSASWYISDREVSARYERSGCERDGYTETLLGNNDRSMTSSLLADSNASHLISDREFLSRYEMGSCERDEYPKTLLDNNTGTTALCLLVDTSTSGQISDRDSPRDVGLCFTEVNKWREMGSSITPEVTESATIEQEGSSHSAIWERIRRLEDRLQHLGESQALLSEEGECSSHEKPSLYPDDISISYAIPERVNRYEEPKDPYYHCLEDASENSENVHDVFEVECGVESVEHKLLEGLQNGAENCPRNDDEQCEISKDLEDLDRKTMNLSPNIIGSPNPEITQNLDMLSLLRSSQPLAESTNDPDHDVQELIKRLQALESERLFMMQAIKSLRKENTELKLLEEIAQQIRELRGNVRNSTQSSNGSLQQNEFHLSSVFRGILSFVGLKSSACGQDNRLPCRSSKCSEPLLARYENHVGLTHLLDDPSPSVASLCMMRELKVAFPSGTRLKA